MVLFVEGMYRTCSLMFDGNGQIVYNLVNNTGVNEGGKENVGTTEDAQLCLMR